MRLSVDGCGEHLMIAPVGVLGPDHITNGLVIRRFNVLKDGLPQDPTQLATDPVRALNGVGVPRQPRCDQPADRLLGGAARSIDAAGACGESRERCSKIHWPTASRTASSRCALMASYASGSRTSMAIQRPHASALGLAAATCRSINVCASW